MRIAVMAAGAVGGYLGEWLQLDTMWRSLRAGDIAMPVINGKLYLKRAHLDDLHLNDVATMNRLPGKQADQSTWCYSL